MEVIQPLLKAKNEAQDTHPALSPKTGTGYEQKYNGSFGKLKTTSGSTNLKKFNILLTKTKLMSFMIPLIISSALLAMP